MLTPITLDNYEMKVNREHKPVLLAFIHLQQEFISHTEALLSIAEECRDYLKVCMVNENYFWSLKKQLKVEETPTFIILKKGQEKGRLQGLTDRTLLLNFINQQINQAQECISHEETQHPSGR